MSQRQGSENLSLKVFLAYLLRKDKFVYMEFEFGYLRANIHNCSRLVYSSHLGEVVNMNQNIW